ncbi:MAG: hypothetical protein ACI8W3_001115 [Myxococcota bacterium]
MLVESGPNGTAAAITTRMHTTYELVGQSLDCDSAPLVPVNSFRPEFQPEQAPAALSFVEIVLFATEYTEDEGEVRDMVDALFDCEDLDVSDLRGEHLAVA